MKMSCENSERKVHFCWDLIDACKWVDSGSDAGIGIFFVYNRKKLFSNDELWAFGAYCGRYMLEVKSKKPYMSFCWYFATGCGG